MHAEGRSKTTSFTVARYLLSDKEIYNKRRRWLLEEKRWSAAALACGSIDSYSILNAEDCRSLNGYHSGTVSRRDHYMFQHIAKDHEEIVLIANPGIIAGLSISSSNR